MIAKRLLCVCYSTARKATTLSCIRRGMSSSVATSASGQRVIFQGASATQLLETEYAELPDIEEGEILGKVKAATICGSDLHTMLGRRPKEPFPSILGHEGVIEVIKHKSTDTNLEIGDRLTFTIADFCQHCERCDSGLQQKCLSLFKYGHSLLSKGSGWDGCYATHLVLHKGTHIVKLPDNVPDKIGATLNCALATMTNAVSPFMNLENLEEKREENKQKTVLVQGAGLLGIYSCALFKEAGYGRIYCYDVHDERLNVASKFGAVPLNGRCVCDICVCDVFLRHNVIPVTTKDKNEEQTLKNDSVDTVIEVSGVKKVFKEGMRVVKPGGSYTLIGLVHPNSQLDITAEQIIRKCLTIRGIHNYGPSHLDQAVNFLSSTIDKYPYNELVSPSFDLHQMNEAVELALKKKYLRVCVVPGHSSAGH